MNIKNTGRNPPPNNYDIKSLFKINKSKAKGKTFGLSRLVNLLMNNNLFLIVNVSYRK